MDLSSYTRQELLYFLEISRAYNNEDNVNEAILELDRKNNAEISVQKPTIKLMSYGCYAELAKIRGEKMTVYLDRSTVSNNDNCTGTLYFWNGTEYKIFPGKYPSSELVNM